MNDLIAGIIFAFLGAWIYWLLFIPIFHWPRDEDGKIIVPEEEK